MEVILYGSKRMSICTHCLTGLTDDSLPADTKPG